MHVKTQAPNDCGICAVANLFAIPWRAAAHRVFGNASYTKKKFNTKTRDIVYAIGDLRHKLIRARDWHDIPDRSIVKVIPSACEGTGNWHWVTWRDGLIWDSIHSVPLRPERYTHRLVSYLGKAR